MFRYRIVSTPIIIDESEIDGIATAMSLKFGFGKIGFEAIKTEIQRARIAKIEDFTPDIPGFCGDYYLVVWPSGLCCIARRTGDFYEIHHMDAV